VSRIFIMKYLYWQVHYSRETRRNRYHNISRFAQIRPGNSRDEDLLEGAVSAGMTPAKCGSVAVTARESPLD
jgi:hypothetical protein